MLKKLFVLAKEFFRDADFGIAQLPFWQLNRLFPFVRFFEIFAIERTDEGDFSLGSAADCADVAAYCRAETAGSALLTDLTENRLRHSI